MFLTGGRQLFDLVLSSGCYRSGCCIFEVNQLNRASHSGIPCSLFRRIMFFDSAGQICCDTGVVGFIATADDVDIPGKRSSVFLCLLLFIHLVFLEYVQPRWRY